MRQVLLEGLAHGAGLSVFMLALVLASLRQNPRIWQSDAPKAVQALLGPVDERTRRQKRAWGAVLLAGLLGTFGHLAATLHAEGFSAVTLGAFVCFETFNLFDAVVIDLGLVIAGPQWAYPPGTRGHPAFLEPGWHLRNFAKGVVGGVPFALLVGALSSAAGVLAG